MAGETHTTDDAAELQRPKDVAVVTPTVLRPSLLRAARSVFEQDFDGTIQLLLGVDKPLGDPAVLDEIRAACPGNRSVTVVDPGYSTAARNGGLYANWDGGALRTVLSYLANSRYVAYLDDDNWWAPDHLSSLRAAIRDTDWAFSLRWYVDPATFAPLCVDAWESVGPGKGVFAEKAGGFVDPNCLMIDKIACEPVLRRWSDAMYPDRGEGADRLVFDALRQGFAWAATGRATSYYVISPDDSMHRYRRQWIGRKTGTKAG